MLWPDIAPLVDLPGHMGRYRVQLDLGQSPALQQFYDYDWALIGNLGVDLLVELLAPLMGLEPAVRLIVLMIPPLTAAGPDLGGVRGAWPGAADRPLRSALRL